MMITRKYWALLLVVLLFTAQSCSDELETDLISEDALALRGGGNGGPGGANQGDIELTDLTHEVSTEWADLFLTVDRYAYGMRPNATARAIAYINLAAYETAAPFMRSYETTSRKFQDLKIDQRRARKKIDIEVALNAVYADVLDHFMTNVDNGAKAGIATLEASLQNEFQEDLSTEEVQNSTAWGAYVAEQIIAFSQTDEEAEEQILEPQPSSYEPPTGDGYWTYSAEPERALFPYWGKVRTFVISSEKTTSVAPVQYSVNPNSNYYAQMQEVLEVNNTAKEEQNEDLWIAEFWSDDVEGLMMSPPGRQVSLAKQLTEQADLNLQETLVLFLRLGFALNDAAVSTWADKYEHMVMRPSNYIRAFIDPSFQTNLFRLVYWPNPSFPGYPSGHSCFASAAGGVFIDQFGNDINFTDRSHEGRTEFLGEPRTFSTIEDMASENAFSRVPLGVHIRMDCTEGLRLGYEISDAVNKFDLRRGHK